MKTIAAFFAYAAIAMLAVIVMPLYLIYVILGVILFEVTGGARREGVLLPGLPYRLEETNE